MELFILIIIAVFIMLYRGYNGKNATRFINDQVTVLYDKFAPYTYHSIREKVKDILSIIFNQNNLE